MTGSVVRVVFLISVSLFLEKSGGQVLPLDMADNSVDDSYEGCRDAMNQLVMSKLIIEDEKRVPDFKSAWENARSVCTKDGFPLNQSAAIYLYTAEPTYTTNCSYKHFNEATRNGAAAYRSGTFPFYSLHFFLTDAIQQLKKKQKGCMTSFRRTNVKFRTDVLKKKIRFGSFTSTTLKQHLTHFGDVSCFKIRTCFGAKVSKYSAFKEEKEVLIPPYEVFRVTNIKNNKWCKVVYKLKSEGKQSNLQCAKITSTSPAPLQPSSHSSSLSTSRSASGLIPRKTARTGLKSVFIIE